MNLARRAARAARAAVVIVLLVAAAAPAVRADDAADAAYTKRFVEKYPPVASPPATLAEFANPKRYDELFMGEDLDRALANVHNQGGAMAWGLSYRMVSLNEMARATGDAKYLAANLRCIKAALAARDDKTGRKVYDGRVLPAWSSDGYRKGEQAVFAVHTGMIAYPMLEAVHVARTLKGVPPELLRELEQTVPAVLGSLPVHDDAYRDGPGEGEAHYVMLGEETGSEGKPQPGNRIAAMGRAMYAAYRVTREPKYLERSKALGTYIKRRIPLAENGAYVWGYWLPLGPVATTQFSTGTSEDTSHGSLTMSFPAMLAEDGVVFTPEDMRRFGKTVVAGLGRLDNGVLFGDVAGAATSSEKRLGHPANWLQLAPYAPEVRGRIAAFYLKYKPNVMPSEMAYLIRYGADAK